MGKVIWIVSRDTEEEVNPPTPQIADATLKEKGARLGWNNRFCESCGRPYTRPPPWSSFPDVKNHPDYPEYKLTMYCNKGLCNGVQPSGECKPRAVKTE